MSVIPALRTCKRFVFRGLPLYRFAVHAVDSAGTSIRRVLYASILLASVH
jgi:hypothetical protein